MTSYNSKKDDTPLPRETKPKRASDTFWSVLTAILYLGSALIVAVGSFTILPVFGVTGIMLFGVTGLLCLIAVALIWLFSKMSGFLGDF